MAKLLPDIWKELECHRAEVAGTIPGSDKDEKKKVSCGKH